MFLIKKMSAEDFSFAVHVTDTMTWNLSQEDFKFMTNLEPDGCFIIFDDSKKIGVATTISYNRVGWLGNVIVSEKYRSKGAGALLVKHSLEYLFNRGVETVGLYSYFDKVPLYRKLGFMSHSVFTVMKGNGLSNRIIKRPKEVTEKDVSQIIYFDRFYFGASRKKLLKPMLLDSKNLCFASFKDKKILGFIVAKTYGDTAEVGPLVCPQGCDNIAIDLLKSILDRLKGVKVSLCIPKEESLIIDILKKHGFKELFQVVKMFYGNTAGRNCIYIAESLERG